MSVPAQRKARLPVDTEEAATLPHEFQQPLEPLGVHPFDRDEENRPIGFRAVAELAAADGRIADDFVGKVIAAVPVFVDRLPHQREPRHVGTFGKRFVLHPHRAPHIGQWRQHADVGVHIRLLQHGRQPPFVIHEMVQVRPPGVILIVIGPVTDPTRERRFGRRIVEPVEHRVRNARKDAVVGAQLQEFERRSEDEVGVGHILGADRAAAGEMASRRHVFVDHRVAPSAAVILVTHLLAEAVLEPVGRPRLPFGNIAVQAATQRMDAAPVSLYAREHAQRTAPFAVRYEETFVDQFGLRAAKVVAHTVDPPAHRIAHLHAVTVVDHIPHAAGLVHRQRQQFHRVVPPAADEFFAHIVAPIGAFQFEPVDEKRADVVPERPDATFDRTGHPRKVLAHRLRIEVVKRRPVRARNAVDHLHEAVHLDQSIKRVRADQSSEL